MTKICSHCDGKGFIDIRDCSGDIQHEETCTYCDGTGKDIDVSDSDS